MPVIRLLPGLAILALSTACASNTSKSSTTDSNTCTLTVQTVDTPREMPRDKSACFFRWTWTVKPAPTTITYFEVETTRHSPGSDDGVPDGLRIGVLESFASSNVLFEDQVRFDTGEKNREVYDLGKGWRGWFAPDDPLEMPRGAWFVELFTDWDNCDDTEEITLTFEDVIGDDCGDPVDTGSTSG